MLETDDYIYVWTPKATDKVIKDLDKHQKLALDIETCCKQEYRAITPLKMQALDPHTGEISVMSLNVRGQKPIVLDILLLNRQGYDWRSLKTLLSTREYILAQNATFELKWLYHTFGVWFTNFRCTLIAARLHANATGSKYAKLRKLGLASLCRDFLGIKVSGKGAGSEQVTDWYPRPLSLPYKLPSKLNTNVTNTINLFKKQTGVALSDISINEHDEFLRAEWHNKLKYSAGDVIHLFELEELLREIITGPLPYSPILYDGATEGPYGLGMHKTYKQSMKALVGFAMIEYNGLPTSRELLNNVYDNVYNKYTMTGTAISIAAQLCQEFELQTEEDWFSDEVKPALASLKILNSPPKLNSLITRLIKVGTLDKVDGLTLQRLIDLLGGIDYYSEDEYGRYQELEFIEDSDRVQCSKVLKLLVDYKRLMKLKSIDLREYINPVTGCIHSSVKQAAAATGRSASSSPNSQNYSGRTPVEIERPLNNLFPSSAKH